jgi:hypothetical protein
VINSKKLLLILILADEIYFDQSIFSQGSNEKNGGRLHLLLSGPSSTAGQRGWAKYRDKGLAALNYGVKIAPVPPPELFPRAAGLCGRTEMIWGSL